MTSERRIQKSLDSYLSVDGVINGNLMQEGWFPQVDFDIFLSHSHQDKDLALTLAGFFLSEFNLTTFIDSNIWGYANNLIKELDNKYSWLDETRRIYNYEKTLYSASHVHSMLTNALMMMMDKSECLFFLNTPNSISTDSIMTDSTESSWIYSEISMSQMLRKRTPKREYPQKLIKAFTDKELVMEDSKFIYELDLNHLTELEIIDIIAWVNSNNQKNDTHSLDVLYKLQPFKRSDPPLYFIK